ncbi:hypothetical protein [Antarctobacter sp.]|uniref:hypothetical protein n=1 Tax=Antarctobacter sp. TaxID=1872577 RepID=UPI003A915959
MRDRPANQPEKPSGPINPRNRAKPLPYGGDGSSLNIWCFTGVSPLGLTPPDMSGGTVWREFARIGDRAKNAVRSRCRCRGGMGGALFLVSSAMRQHDVSWDQMYSARRSKAALHNGASRYTDGSKSLHFME